MDFLGEHTSLQDGELENLTKYSANNEDYEEILKATKECLSIQELWMTLFQIAVVHNNLDLIKYLSRSGPGYINAKNSLGDIPLLMAMKSDYFEAVTILLDAGADVGVTDASTGKTALQLLISSKGLADIIPHIMSNLKKSNLESEKLGILLLLADCPLEHVITMNDAQVTKAFLERDLEGNQKLGMNLAMERHDLENVELILRHGNVTGTEAFYKNLWTFMDSNEMESWKFFIERLFDWDVIREEDIFKFFHMFMSADVEYLQVLLDCKIDLQVREKFEIDLRAAIFGNRRVDAIELLQRNQPFNVNATAVLQQTALHFAVMRNLTTNVRFLLDSRADVDIKDNKGRTALFYCTKRHSIESGRLLLEHGADVQVADNNGLTVFHFARNEKSALLPFLLAQLAFSHVQGVPMKPAIQMQIDMYEDYKNTFEACCQQLQVLKTLEVTESITLFDILTGKIETLYHFLRDKDILAILDQYKNQHDLHSLYYFKIITKLKETSNLYRFSCRVAEIISKKIGTVVDFDHLVVSAISRYLTEHDIQEFLISIQ